MLAFSETVKTLDINEGITMEEVKNAIKKY